MTAPVKLPHTWRPFGARIAATVFGAMLAIVVITVWIAWGPEVRARFTFGQRLTLIGFGLGVLACWWALVRSRISADDHGVTVVNGYRTRTYEWTQVVAVNLRRGAPWATFDLSDGTSISVIALQTSDGDRTIRAVRELRVLVEDHSRVDRDD